MEEENLSNQEDQQEQLKTPEQEEFEKGLQEIADLDNLRPPEVKKERLGVMGKLKKVAKPVILALGSVIAAGAGAQAAEQRSVPRPEPTGNAEQRVDSEAQKTFEKNKDFLRKEFQSISGGGIGKSENGNLVVFAGGSYYELDSSTLNSLMQIAQRHRIGLEGTSKFDKAFHLKKTEASKMFIKGKIIELGKKVDLRELPKNLKEFESARRQIRDEMNDFGKENKHQNSSSRQIKSQKATSSEAGEFLN
jgi:hypothetical protein